MTSLPHASSDTLEGNTNRWQQEEYDFDPIPLLFPPA